MGSSNVGNGTFAFDGTVLHLFGQRACVANGKWHFVNEMHILIEEEPNPVSPRIEEVLNQDIADCKWDRVAYLLVNPVVALKLFLEGKIMRRHIENAEASELAVIFQEVSFDTIEGKKNLAVVVTRTNTRFATMDEKGEVV